MGGTPPTRRAFPLQRMTDAYLALYARLIAEKAPRVAAEAELEEARR